jgi:DNA-binding winged helix-turn-helix (wHTH) protein/energy-coupling factor transporter ATP-binding protein EcfA2
MSLSNQSLTFRNSEVKRLLNWLRAGESASIIGVSGVGKSNLFNHLLDPEVQKYHLKQKLSNYLFVRVNFHYLPDFSTRSIYSLILEQFELLGDRVEQVGLAPTVIDEIGEQHEALLNAGDDLLRVQRYFKLAMRSLLGGSQNRLVLLCDQFDDVYQEADERLFANLRGLREAYKYRLSYLVFTRDVLTSLAPMDSGREEFYELLASNVMGLKPYNQEDAQLLLGRVAGRNRWTVEESVEESLLGLTGRHAGLLRAAFMTIMQNDFALEDGDRETAVSLLTFPAIQAECSKIWNSLTVEEHRLLAYCVHEIPSETVDKSPLKRLQLKGLLDEETGRRLFSPLFAAYVKNQEALWERPLYLDERTRQVWVLGQPTSALTALEYRLFDILYQRLETLVTKDELINAGWPAAQGGVSDEALTAALYRLRKKIEPEPDNPQFLESLRDQGYRLHTD